MAILLLWYNPNAQTQKTQTVRPPFVHDIENRQPRLRIHLRGNSQFLTVRLAAGSGGRSALAACLLRQQVGMDVRQDTTLGNSDVTQQLVQLLVIPDGKLEVARDDTRLLVIAGGVTCQLENFGGEVLKNCGEVNWSAGTDPLRVVALPQETVNTADRECQTSLRRPRLGILGATGALATGFAATSHFGCRLKRRRRWENKRSWC